MKKLLLSVAIATFSTVAFAADVVVSTTTGTGTITEYAPGTTFIVKESSGPVTYHYGKSVTYVTRKGTTLSEDQVRTRIKVGVPVHVHYATEGSNRVISRIEVDED